MYKNLFKDEKIRFLVVGVANTAVGYGTYAAVVFFNGHYLLANIISTIVGVTCSYFLNKYYTFKQYRKSLAEACRFISVYTVSFVLSNIILYILVSCLDVSPYIAGMVNLVFVTLISWFGHRYFSFRL